MDEEKKSKWKALNSKLVSAVKMFRENGAMRRLTFCDKNECRAYLQYKNNKRIRRCQRTCQDKDSDALNG